jgi:hypothetical protein
MKTILAMLIAGTFAVSAPAFAGDKPADGKDKKEKKDEGKKDEAKKDKAGGGGW